MDIDAEDTDTEYLVKLGPYPRTEVRDISIHIPSEDSDDVRELRWTNEYPQEDVAWKHLHRLRTQFELGHLVVCTLDGKPLNWRHLLDETLPESLTYAWLDGKQKPVLVEIAKDMGLGTTADPDDVPKGEKCEGLGRGQLITKIRKFVKAPEYKAWRAKKAEDRAGMGVADLEKEALDAQAKLEAAQAALALAERKREEQVAAIRAKRAEETAMPSPEIPVAPAKPKPLPHETAKDPPILDADADLQLDLDDDEDAMDWDSYARDLDALTIEKLKEEAMGRGLVFKARDTKPQLIEAITAHEKAKGSTE